VLGKLFWVLCIRVGTPLNCLILFYLFFADKKKTKLEIILETKKNWFLN